MPLDELSISGRIERVLDHLSVGSVHVAACMSGDWGDFLLKRRERVRSLTIVAPHLNKGIPDGLQDVPIPALVLTGDRGTSLLKARSLADSLSRGELFELRDYASPPWADTVADRTADVVDAIRDFLLQVDQSDASRNPEIAADDGEVAGIKYRVRGQGPPLLLLPLSMAPSQWEPLISPLSGYYTTILLGGPHLGMVSLLEDRAKSGYGRLVAHVVDQADLRPGETVLEVGCGSGALARELARRTSGRNAIVAADLNDFFLSEARDLTVRDDFGGTISFEKAHAEDLPYADGRFDLSYCCTVMEEGRADRMLSELVRVTRPGGRVAVMTRALDVDWWANLPLARGLNRKINALGPATSTGVGEGGCADASLYRRLVAAGTTPLFMGPQYAIYRDGERLTDVLERLVALLPDAEAETCRDAIREADADGSLLVGEPFHCAVGRKPFNSEGSE